MSRWLLVVAVSACHKPHQGEYDPASADEVAAARTQIAVAAKKAAEQQVRWSTAIRAAELDVAPAGLVDPCAQRPSSNAPRQHDQLEAQLLAQQLADSRSHKIDVALVHGDELATAMSPRKLMVDALVAEVAKVTLPINSDVKRWRETATQMASDAWWTTDIVVVIAEDIRPVVGKQPGTFLAGLATGRSYLFDYAAGQVACAGAFDAQSGEVVKYGERFDGTGRKRTAISDDLDARALQAGLEALRAISASSGGG